MQKQKLQRFSEYSLSTYLLCPRKYRYTYIEKPFKNQKKALNVNFIFGNIIHQACKYFYDKKAEDRTLDSLHNLFRELWKRMGIRSFFNTREEEREMGIKGLEMLSNFFNTFANKVPYNREEYMEVNVRDYILFGRVDRIDISSDSHLHIVDYKTTKYYDVGEDNKDRDRKTIQLKFYAYLLDKLRSNVATASFYHFDEDKFDTVEFSHDSILYIGEWFDEIINDIRYDRVYNKSVGPHCKFCDFVSKCYNNENSIDDITLSNDEIIANENELF